MFFCFGVLTNLLVSISMLQGCVAVVNALCGVNLYGELPVNAKTPFGSVMVCNQCTSSDCRFQRVSLTVSLTLATNTAVYAVLIRACRGAAMAYIIPISTMAYAAVGGLKATFTTSYMHTVIIYVVCLVFMFKVFVRGDLLGGIDDVRQPASLFYLLTRFGALQLQPHSRNAQTPP